MTAKRWRLLRASKAQSLAAAQFAFANSGQPCPTVKALNKFLGTTGESHETKQITLSTGGLRAWLDGRTRESCVARGDLTDSRFVCAAFKGLTSEADDSFEATFVTEGWFKTLEKLSPKEEGLEVFADCTNKTTERRLVCVEFQSHE